MLTRKAALEKIGKVMGQNKFDDDMGGSMLPRGDIDVAHALKIIYGGNTDAIYKELQYHCEKEYKACFERMRRKK